jgi:hypothetical protein
MPDEMEGPPALSLQEEALEVLKEWYDNVSKSQADSPSELNSGTLYGISSAIAAVESIH